MERKKREGRSLSGAFTQLHRPLDRFGLGSSPSPKLSHLSFLLSIHFFPPPSQPSSLPSTPSCHHSFTKRHFCGVEGLDISGPVGFVQPYCACYIQRHIINVWSCLCQEHSTNLATGVSRLPVLDCGTTFHPGFDGRDFPSTLLDDLWRHIFLATEAPSDSFEL